VSLDPWGHRVTADFDAELVDGMDIRPTIAITKARLMLPEVREAIELGRLSQDGVVVHAGGEVSVIKAAIDPVWHLPGVAKRFGVTEAVLRRTLFEQTAGMYPELVTRRDLHVFLPPIGGTTLYIFGDPSAIHDPARVLTCRIHDECNGSDVFGSDICTCRPYLTHGVEECIRTAQAGGAGLIVYNRKEGRALGEVTKFLVYNARKRQVGGDQAATYFARTECVAGVQDARFPTAHARCHSVARNHAIDRLISMSNLKYDALIAAGIEIGERVPLPPDLVPPDAMVEIEAKKAAGYFAPESEMPVSGESLCQVWLDVTSRITDWIQRASARARKTTVRRRPYETRAQRLLALALDGRLDDWTVDLDGLAPTADFVAGSFASDIRAWMCRCIRAGGISSSAVAICGSPYRCQGELEQCRRCGALPHSIL
jgi:GTP cyclohydrolase II